MAVLILGSGVSGLAVYNYLKAKNIDCFFAPECIVNSKNLDLSNLNTMLNGVDLAVISPGISLEKSAIFEIKNRNIPIISELEFGFCGLNNDIIAITGTNGKTTTVKLIDHLLNRSKIGSVLCGNVGIPITSVIDKSNSKILVVECSSFQLETIDRFKPHIAVILNISEDHLNRHKTMKNYAACKYNITKNQTKDDYLILNADDDFILKNPPKTKARIFFFSTKKKVEGCYIKRGCIFFNSGNVETKLLSLVGIKLRGEHNLSNILAAVLSVYLQTKNKDVLKNILTFEGVEHRIEFVKEVNGVGFYNDSKATNISSTLVACKSFSENVNLILGGYDKGFLFDDFFVNVPKNIKSIAIIGENKNKIALSARRYNYDNYSIFESLDEAVKYLFKNSKKGEIILLSPASASFDQFLNYEERGNLFKKIVHSLN